MTAESFGENREVSTARTDAPRDATRELDALIAVKVFGWRTPRGYIATPFALQPPDEDDTVTRVIPHYSSDIAAALLVVEAVWPRLRVVLHWCYDGFVAEVFRDGTLAPLAQVGVDPREGGMPLAICRAALAALEAGS